MPSTAPIRLSDLAGAIRSALDDRFGGQTWWVLAEVANHRYYPQKDHHYFDLVEKGAHGLVAKCGAVAWAEGNRRIRSFERLTGKSFGNDILVLVAVSVEYHVVYGLKLTLHDIDARYTLGQLEEQRQKTLERLLREVPEDVWKEGDRYVTTNSRLTLPSVIQRIAVVASEHSAGYEDFQHSLSMHQQGYAFYLEPYFTAVQGTDNAEALAGRLYEIRLSGIPYHAVVIIRGGGAQTDLLLFDEYAIARAVAGMPFPVITGIGHLRNETLTDLLAHTATKTPTECAEYIIAHNLRFEMAALSLGREIALRAQRLLAARNRDLHTLPLRLVQLAQQAVRLPAEQLEAQRRKVPLLVRRQLQGSHQELAHARVVMSLVPTRILERSREKFRHGRRQLLAAIPPWLAGRQAALAQADTIRRMAAPEAVLRRGYALLRQAGRIVTDASRLQPGTTLDIDMHDARLTTTIHTNTPQNGSSNDIRKGL